MIKPLAPDYDPAGSRATAKLQTADELVPKFPPWWLTLTLAVVCTGVLAFVRTLALPGNLAQWLPVGLLPVYAFALIGIIHAAGGLMGINKWRSLQGQPEGWDSSAEQSCIARASHQLDNSVSVEMREQALREFQLSVEKCVDDRCRPLLWLCCFVSVLPIICFCLLSKFEASTNVNQAVFWVAVGVAGGTITWFLSIAFISIGHSTIRSWFDAACIRHGVKQLEDHQRVIHEAVNKKNKEEPVEPEEDADALLKSLPVTFPPERKQKTKVQPVVSDDEVVVRPKQATPTSSRKVKEEPAQAPDNDDYLGDDPLEN